MATAALNPPERLTQAQRATATAGLDALLITPGADLRYLTGYDAKQLERLTCLVLPAQGPVTLIVPTLERPAAESSGVLDTGIRLVDHPDGTDPYPLLTAALDLALDRPVRGVGLGNRMWAEHALAIRDALPRNVTHGLAGPVLRELRMRKSPAEIAALREAGAAIDTVHAGMSRWLRPGRSEAQVGVDIAAAILDAGHASADFVIVASGPNGASPHHETGGRVIERGDVVVIDIGGTMPSGYCSDSTRTYLIGDEAPDGFLECYRTLQRAQAAAVAAVRPGVTAESIDSVARDLLTAAGLGQYFLHRVGHGIGLDGHEDPYLVAGNNLPLEPGMTFSIEPGVYLAGRYGARIEDIVACVPAGPVDGQAGGTGGVERLNTIPTDLVRV